MKSGDRFHREGVSIAHTDVWSDREDMAALVYEGPHGPANIACFAGFRRTRVWGGSIPDGHLDDGPERVDERLAKEQRLRAGVDGAIGELPLHVVRPTTGGLPTRRPVLATFGDQTYTLAPYGRLLARVELRRPDGRLAVQSAIRLIRNNLVAPEASPVEVTLHLLLYSTVATLRPRGF